MPSSRRSAVEMLVLSLLERICLACLVIKLSLIKLIILFGCNGGVGFSLSSQLKRDEKLNDDHEDEDNSGDVTNELAVRDGDDDDFLDEEDEVLFIVCFV